MKTTIKLALLASALLLALAGCKNTFTPTNPSPDSFAKNVEGGNAGKNPLQVKNVKFTGKYVGEGYRVTVSFNRPINPDTAKDAITFYNVEMKGTETVKGSTVAVSMDPVSDKNNTKDLHFKLPKEVKDKYVWVEVVGTNLQAANGGQKMDQDADGVEGEEGDDFYGEEIKIESPLLGYNFWKFRRGGTRDTTIESLFTRDVKFLKAYKADLTDTDSTLGNLVTHISIDNKGGLDSYSVETFGVSNDDFVSLVNKHVKVEQYISG